MVVKLNPQDRRIIRTIAAVPGSVWLEGQWEVLTGAPAVESFRVGFIGWYTVEAGA